MKVISIKEPFASFIKEGYKKIETRSWKTNYRGELFIHSSGKNIAKEFLTNKYVVSLTNELNMNYGNIICRGNLVGCVYMDEDFLNLMKKNEKEFNLGLYEIGRYAWIFEGIEHIYPIPAKCKLNIWNYDGDYEMITNPKLGKTK